MSKFVQRFILKAHPTDGHPKYYSWNVAQICILVGDDDRQRALERALKKLKDEKWIIISDINKSTLIEERVKLAGGEILKAYNEAKQGEVIFEVWTENKIGFKDSPPIYFPRITERFIDKVIEHAGGERLEYESNGKKNKNADYIIGNYIFELKILEEERLYNESVQNKIADLLYDPSKAHIEISEHTLSSTEYNNYVNLFRTPIQNAVKSASKQIKSTRKIIEREDYLGGLIFINNGTSSITPNIFNECLVKSINNDTKQIDTFISICNWVKTNGFDSSYIYEISPEEMNEFQHTLATSFNHIMTSFLTEFGHEGFTQTSNMLEPLKNISYEKYGVVFTKYGAY